MSIQSYDTTKVNLQGWKESLLIRSAAHKAAIINLKRIEEEFKKAKKIKNRTYKDLREARTKVRSMKQRVRSYPSYVRRWANRNPGKAMEVILCQK